MIGRVSLVGAGPGDPELLTLRALKRLQEADVVLHDALIDPRVLDLATRARRVDVGKRAAGQRTAQEYIERLMVRLCRRGHSVVRLKGGDPFVFGRGGEEALTLCRAGIPFEIVPGVSSALAAPALCGIPVTHRGTSAALLVLSGHDVAAARAVLGTLPPGSATVVVLMARERRGEIARLLLVAGWRVDTPAALIQSASLKQQKDWRGSLAELADSTLGGGLDPRAPSLLVIGEAVAVAAQLRPTLDETQAA
jgi:uroporphyrin-III C-methyltransferase